MVIEVTMSIPLYILGLVCLRSREYPFSYSPLIQNPFPLGLTPKAPQRTTFTPQANLIDQSDPLSSGICCVFASSYRYPRPPPGPNISHFPKTHHHPRPPFFFREFELEFELLLSQHQSNLKREKRRFKKNRRLTSSNLPFNRCN